MTQVKALLISLEGGIVICDEAFERILGEFKDIGGVEHILLVPSDDHFRFNTLESLANLYKQAKRLISKYVTIELNLLILPHSVPTEMIYAFYQTYGDVTLVKRVHKTTATGLDSKQIICAGEADQPGGAVSGSMQKSYFLDVIWGRKDTEGDSTPVNEGPVSSATCSSISDTLLDSSLEGLGSVMLGGTFDRLHSGHYIFLLVAYFIYQNGKMPQIRVDDDGVFTSGFCVAVSTSSKLIGHKYQSGKIESIRIRINRLKAFFNLLHGPCPYIMELEDSYGPAVLDCFGPDDVLICTADNIESSMGINRKRRALQYTDISLIIMPCLDGPDGQLSSSKKRGASLDTIIR